MASSWARVTPSLRLYSSTSARASSFEVGNVRLVTAGFAPFQNHHISGVQQERVALLRQGGAQRHISVAVSRHPFGKLRHVIQVIDPVADLGAVLVNVAACVVAMAPSGRVTRILSPSGMRNRSLPLASRKQMPRAAFFHVLLQHLPAIAVDIQVIIALHGIQPQRIGILRRIHPESVLRNKILGKTHFLCVHSSIGKGCCGF